MKGFSKEELRKDFPNIVKEIEETPSEDNLSVKVDRSRGYSPNVIDFIKRCERNEEAIEIIDYLEKRKEITPAYANSLRKQVNEKGVRSFGTKRSSGYYFRAFGKR